MRRFSVGLLLVLPGLAGAQVYRPPGADDIQPPQRGDLPVITCTRVELARLREAWRGGHATVASIVRRARGRRAQEPLSFPPRGGQHNQWYQCDACQVGLKTVGASEHRCPRCKKVYAGAPYDDVIFSRVHRSNFVRAHDAAWAYALTGDETLARDAAKILLGYADRYRTYPYHTNSLGGKRKAAGGGHILEQSLSEASLLLGQVAPAFDLVWPALGDAQRRHVAEDLLRPMVENIGRTRRGKSNWQSFHNAAMFAGGALLGDAAWMRRSILAEKQGFLFQMGACVSKEGMWYENSWGYHLYTLKALTAHAEAARRCGIDLWGHPALRRMVELPFDYAVGDGLPRFGDDVGAAAFGDLPMFQAAAAALPDVNVHLGGEESFDGIMYAVDGRDRRAGPPRRSAVFADAGHAILRTFGQAPMDAVMTFGPFGGFHGHFDKLSFVFYTGAHELGVDPGRARSQAYRLPIHKLWYRGTIAHNTVVVDGRPQEGAAGALLLFQDRKDAGYRAAAARCDTAYPGVCHARCLLLTDSYLLVLDVLTAGDGKARRYDWVYHNRGTGITSAAVDAGRAGKLDMSGEEYVRVAGSGATDGPLVATFVGRRGESTLPDTRLRLAAAGKTEVFTGDGPGASVMERIPMIIARRRGVTCAFAAVLQPEPGPARRLAEVVARQRDGRLRVDVTHGDKRDSFAWDGGEALTVELR